MKTLIHHGGSLGDTLLSLPCFEKIRKSSVSLHLIGERNVAGFLNEAGLIDAFSSADSAVHASLYTDVDARERAFLSQFDRAFVFTAVTDSPAAAGIHSVIPRTRIILTVPPGGARIHAAQYRLTQLSGDAAPLRPSAFQLPSGALDGAHALLRRSGYREGQQLVAVHPGSGGRKKSWPLDRYFEFVTRLAADFRPFILFFSGPAEDGELKSRVESFSRERSGVCHVTGAPLTAAAALLSQCNLYAGNDSGFSHLAAASGCRAAVLFGPTDPLVWRPAGSSVEVISADFPSPIDRIDTDSLCRSAASFLARKRTPIG